MADLRAIPIKSDIAANIRIRDDRQYMAPQAQSAGPDRLVFGAGRPVGEFADKA
jgi:hypothetical protein